MFPYNPEMFRLGMYCMIGSARRLLPPLMARPLKPRVFTELRLTRQLSLARN